MINLSQSLLFFLVVVQPLQEGSRHELIVRHFVEYLCGYPCENFAVEFEEYREAVVFVHHFICYFRAQT